MFSYSYRLLEDLLASLGFFENNEKMNQSRSIKKHTTLKLARQRVATIDIGSNAIRLLIGELDHSPLCNTPKVRVIKKLRAPVRLGRDVFVGGSISTESTEKALRAFSQFVDAINEDKVTQVRAVATSAVREAKNRKEFIKTVSDVCGFQIQLIDGIEEARLIHQAVKSELDIERKNALLIDIGGGSVEVSFSEKGQLTSTQSFPLGTVRLLEKLNKAKLKEGQLAGLLQELTLPLQHFLDANIRGLNLDFAVGTGGNLEAMGNLKVDLLNKNPKTFVTIEELEILYSKLKSYSLEDRIKKLDLRKDRADVIIPAILLVKTILHYSGIFKIMIPGVGLRDGLLLSALKQN